MVCKGFFYLAIFLIGFQEQFHPVLSDFRIIDQLSNKVVFQTASDFVRTGCGSFLKKSYLIPSDPLEACEAPPLLSRFSIFISFIFGRENDDGLYQRVLLAKEGGCDMKTKLRNAAAAGYSGVIIGSSELWPAEDEDDEEEFLDFHLVSPLDVGVLQKNFSQSENFVLEPPGLSRCKEKYHRTWLRSRYISLLIKCWKKIMDACWQIIVWTLLQSGKLAKGIKAVLPVFYNKDTYSSIAFYLASIVISITIMMIVSIQNNAKKLLKYRNVQHEIRKSESESSNSKSEPSKPFTPPPPPRTKTSSQQRAPIDYTLRHRINLNISINDQLTKAKINLAYREMAKKYHPDKNLHLDSIQLAKITEEFRSKKKSRDILLLYCVE